MSFFDEGDEPPRRGRGGAGTARPLRRPAQGGGARGSRADDQQRWVRRGVAIGIGLLVLILLVIAIKGCVDSQKETGLKDYNRQVGSLVTQSDNEVGDKLFELLSNGANARGQNLQVQVNGLRADQDRLLAQTRDLDVPDEMNGAQDDFVTVMELRRDALARTAAELPAATGNGRGSAQAVARIAGQMQAFLASDILYSQRVVPQIEAVFRSEDITGQRVAQSRFIDDPLSWMDKGVVAEKLGGQAGAARPRGPVAPGLHGHALNSVAVGDVTLNADAANRIPATGQLTFTVSFSNQGENPETRVPVMLSITGAGRPINAQTAVPNTEAAADATAEIPLRQTPPIGTPVTIKVTVGKVPGEEKTDNNTQSFPAVFTR